MFSKKIMILLILFVSILTISAVSAVDNSTDDVNSLKEANDEVISIDETDLMGQSENNNVLKLDNGTFADLQKKIDGATENSTVTLDNEYKYDESFRISGIVVNKILTVDGQGHTIDGNDGARIFNVTNPGVVFKNIVFVNANTGDNGGAIFGSCSIINCNFSNNSAEGQGGAIYSKEGNLSVVNCNFDGNFAYEGGAIFSEDIICSVADSCFRGNKAYMGGAIYNGAASNCIFEMNGAVKVDGDDDGDGGAMYGGSAVNCTFTANYADDDGDGGALSHVNAENCIFTNNTADDNGGAIYMGSAKNCNFTDNSAEGQGGAIYVKKENYSVVNCNFDGNFAYKGGAIFSEDIICSVADSCFRGNKAYRGGAIYNGAASNCIFEMNGAVKVDGDDDGDGGAMYGGSAVNCTFTANYATDDGDGAALSHSRAENCIFTNNTADNCGGAIYYTDAVNCIFTNNSAEKGGAIHKGDASYCTFIINHANEGGAIYEGNAENCNFTNNSAYHGGAIHGNSDGEEIHVSATDCVFTNNIADGGGAVYQVNSYDCYFIKNNSTTDGGAVYEGYALNCTFISNRAARNGDALYAPSQDGCTRLLCLLEDNDEYNVLVEEPEFQLSSDYSLNQGDSIPISLYFEADSFAGYDAKLEISGDAEFNCILKTGTNWVVDLPKGKYLGQIYVINRTNGSSVGTFNLDVVYAKATINISNIYFTYGYNDTYTITLTDMFNRPISNFELNIDYMGNKTYKTDENGQIILATEGLTPGFYGLRFTVDGIYTKEVVETAVCIDKDSVTLTAVSLDTTYNDTEEFTVGIFDSKNMPLRNITLALDLNGLKNYTTDENGQIKVSTKSLTPGTYDANVTFSENRFYYGASSISKVTVKKQFTKLISDSIVKQYNVSGELVITLNNAQDNPVAGALIFVDLAGIKNYTTDENGQIKVSVKDLGVNTYTANITYGGNELYQKSNTVATVLIDRIFTKLNSTAVTKEYEFEREFIFDLKDDYGNPVANVSVVLDIINGTNTYVTDANGQIKFYIVNDEKLVIELNDEYGNSIEGVLLYVDLNGATKNYTTDKNGQIMVSTKDLAPNTYVANITFGGDNVYYGSNVTAKITINKIIPKVTVDSLKTIIYNASEVLTVIFKDNQDLPMVNRTVSVDLNGVKKYVTDENGQIDVPLQDLLPGSYVAKISMDEDKYYMGCEVSSVIVVNKADSRLKTTDVVTIYGVDKNAVITLNNNNGDPIVGAEIFVNFGDGKYITDANGQVNLSTKGVVPNTYDLVISFDGDARFNESTGFVEIVVSKAASILTAVGVNTVYGTDKNAVITLNDVNGNPISGAEIFVNFGDVKYITDAKGQVNLSTKGVVPNTYYLLISFGGDSIFNESTGFVKVVVSKATPKLTAKTKSFKKSDKTKKYTVTLKTNTNKYLSGKTVKITVNKKTYTAKTNSKGVATFKLTNLTKKGKYTAVVKYAGDKYYNAKTVKPKITVK